VTLPPRGAAPADIAAAPAFAAARSTVVVHAEVPFAGIRQALEAKVGRRGAEERDRDIGAAGHLEYTVDRGPFTVGVQGDSLVVETPLEGHARACAKGRCYAGCDPTAKATARVPLALGPDYRFRPSSVQVAFVRGCKVRALGGILEIDVTPALESGIRQQTRTIAAEIDRELPDLRPQAERLWTEIGKARPLPLGACVVVAPEGIVQGPPSGIADAARLRFGLLSRPEVRTRCGDPPKQVALPPLQSDPALPPEGDVHLGIVLGPEAVATAIEGADVDLGSARSRVARAAGPPLALALSLYGEACGDLSVRAERAAWSADGRSLALGVVPVGGEVERAAALALDANALARSIERAPIAVPLATKDLETILPDLARGMSDDHQTVSAVVSESKPESAGLRGSDTVGVVHLRGSATIRAR
jgi:hypothetical protein